MNLVHRAEDFHPAGRGVCVAIGVFDGVHLGHQRVIQQARQAAREAQGFTVAVTFDRHPNEVVCPSQAPLMIYPQTRKIQVLAGLGVDAVLLLRFDGALSRVPAADFILALHRAWPSLASIHVGTDFTFGYQRSGNLALLRQLGARQGFAVSGLEAVALSGQNISSTRIREAIAGGDFARASELLGRPYGLSGPVVRGDGLGRTLGFATANLETTGLVVPPGGVYAAHAMLADHAYPAVLNIGRRPTLKTAASPLRVEAHLLDYAADLYGQWLEIRFRKKLREEQPFDSLAALKRQIQQDVIAARRWL